MAEGTPEDVVKVKASYTGHYLKPLLERGKQQTPAISLEKAGKSTLEK